MFGDFDEPNSAEEMEHTMAPILRLIDFGSTTDNMDIEYYE
jgi:hypothetical protein